MPLESTHQRDRTRHIAHSPPLVEHSLVWIVYSAEMGYRYSGDEYWQTFEKETAGWTVYGNRYAIREFYRSFQRTFGGATPAGAWAEHFSIICWPITHAILPRDLQRQLARVLYELRHSFSADVFESPSLLGDLIATRAWSGTSRFQNLSQETQLVGQIAAALLLQDEYGTARLIHPLTLKRITTDLDGERRAREWLRGARHFAMERATVRGLISVRGKARQGTTQVENARLDVAALGIEPRLVLRPLDRGATGWAVSLEIPDLSHLLLRFPKARDVLTGSRCIVAGSSGRPLARGRCLHGSQQVTLVHWPSDDEVLLKFDQSDEQLEYLLRTECLLRPGPTWLFRIASDGFAYESRSLRVRAGERYVILNTSGLLAPGPHLKPAVIHCEGIQGAVLSVPLALTPSWETALQYLGLAVAKSIEVWPAGLAAIAWDGEGRGEWLASERPCLAIQADHPVDAIIVSVATEPAQSIELSPVVPGQPLFVELPQLNVGLHNVSLATRNERTTGDQLLGDLNVVIRITENRPWTPGVTSHGPLLVHIDPPNPSLEHLWEGRVDLSLNGPAGHNLTATLLLFERDGDPPILSQQLPPMSMPISASSWRAHFEKFCRDVHKVQAAYDRARLCEITFAAEELGALTLHCEREVTPLRWFLDRDGRATVVCLLNDTDDVADPRVTYSSFESSAAQTDLGGSGKYQVPAIGGLYCAELTGHKAAIIAPPSVTSLHDLCCQPSIARQQRSSAPILGAIRLAGVWADARLPGDPISAKRQRDVLDAFAQHIIQVIGGDHWLREEMASRRADGAFDRLVGAVSRRREEVALGVIINRDAPELAVAPCDERAARLAELAVRYLGLPLISTAHNDSVNTQGSTPQGEGAENVRWLAELALRLASCPAGVESWAGEELKAGLARLLDEVPTLARAARLLVLSTDRYLNSNVAQGEVYAGWRWG